jgi:hypothetical protein
MRSTEAGGCGHVKVERGDVLLQRASHLGLRSSWWASSFVSNPQYLRYMRLR